MQTKRRNPLFDIQGENLPLKVLKYSFIKKKKAVCFKGIIIVRACPVWLFATLWTIACQAPLFMGISRQEDWSRLPFPSLEDLPNSAMEWMSPVLQADSLSSEPQINSIIIVYNKINNRVLVVLYLYYYYLIYLLFYIFISLLLFLAHHSANLFIISSKCTFRKFISNDLTGSNVRCSWQMKYWK